MSTGTNGIDTVPTTLRGFFFEWCRYW